MAIFTCTQVIGQPIGEVFSTVADAGNFDKWNPTITKSRKLSEGEVGLGSRFEWRLRGFGSVVQEFGEFETNERIRIVPQMKGLQGGHLFVFTAEGNGTRIEHELVMLPFGWFRLFGPLMGIVGRRNLRDTTQALQKYLESR